MNDTIKALLSELKSGLAQIYADRLRGLYLFGSYATGQQHPESDLDVLIVLDRLDSYGAEIDRTGPLVSAISLSKPRSSWHLGRQPAAQSADRALFSPGPRSALTISP